MFSRFKVSGHSMMPAIKPGQEILVSSLPYLIFNPKKGDIIAFKVGSKFVVKRIKQAGNGKFLVGGDNRQDSREFGWVERERIIGKVIYPWAVKI